MYFNKVWVDWVRTACGWTVHITEEPNGVAEAILEKHSGEFRVGTFASYEAAIAFAFRAGALETDDVPDAPVFSPAMQAAWEEEEKRLAAKTK